MDTIKEIEKWYSSQCDGDWEHGKGIELHTIDNPGWRLKINLIGTDAEVKPFERLEIERDDTDWFHCWIEQGNFEAACGAKNLEDVLRKFIEWVNS